MFHGRVVTKTLDRDVGVVFWVSSKGYRFPMRVTVSEKRNVSEIY